jgi:hypothetical protein
MNEKRSYISPDFEKRVMDILKSKLKGHKTYGGIVGGLLGSGVGGTAGLIDTEKKRQSGELDNLSMEGKMKEYILAALKPGIAGAAIGGGLGVGYGALDRINTAKKIYTQNRKTFKKMLAPFGEASAVRPKVEQLILDRAVHPMPESNKLTKIKEIFSGSKTASSKFRKYLNK